MCTTVRSSAVSTPPILARRHRHPPRRYPEQHPTDRPQWQPAPSVPFPTQSQLTKIGGVNEIDEAAEREQWSNGRRPSWSGLRRASGGSRSARTTRGWSDTIHRQRRKNHGNHLRNEALRRSIDPGGHKRDAVIADKSTQVVVRVQGVRRFGLGVSTSGKTRFVGFELVAGQPKRQFGL